MRLKTPTPMRVIKKEEKEAKLSAFITETINSALATADDGTAKLCLIIARSEASPVAQAAASLASELMSAGYVMQVILASDVSASVDVEEGQPQPLEAASIMSSNGCCRMIKDQRLLDAHEQLILSDRGAWIGDSMRRDPLKIDAYECYAECNSDVANWATSAFERLWCATTRMRIKPLAVVSTSPDADVLIAYENSSEDSDHSKPSVGTRH